MLNRLIYYVEYKPLDERNMVVELNHEPGNKIYADFLREYCVKT